LVKLGPCAVQPLIATLKDRSSGLRTLAAKALAKLDASRAGEPLIAALEDSSQEVRCVAADLLGELGDARAVAPLVKAAKVKTELAFIIVKNLEKVLTLSATSARTEDLMLVRSLDNVACIAWCGGCNYSAKYDTSVDCSPVRQLARQELIRRGIKA
jgi:hypothetical protein